MPKVITEITEEQKARFPEWVEKWTKIGLCTDPMDFPRAKRAVQEIYKRVVSKQPQLILSAPSPFEAVRIGTLEQKKINTNNPNLTFDDIDKSEFVNKVSNLYGGISQAGTASFITFFRDVMDWENEKLEDFYWGEELVHSCGWVWWDEDVAVIVDRPLHIRMQDDRFHSENNAAIEFRDGYKICFWRGTRVPREWILEKEKLDPTIALTHENIELRRCAAEIIGWHNVLKQLNSKVIDKDNDPEIGELLEVDLPDIGKERFLRVLCGTKREFALPVPPEMQTAIEAQAWTWNLTLEEFTAPEVRT